MNAHQKSVVKMKRRVKELTQRSDSKGYEEKKLKLKQFITGWVHYFKLAQMKTLLTEIDQGDAEKNAHDHLEAVEKG